MQAGFFQEVFIVIVVIGFIAGDRRLIRQIDGLLLQGLGVALGAGGQEKFHRLALGGDQQVDFQALEVAIFAGLIAPPRFPWVALATPNSDVIADRNGKTVDDIKTLGVKLMAQTG